MYSRPGRGLKLTFTSDGTFSETRTRVTPTGSITFDINGNMIYPNAGLGITAVANAGDTVNDSSVTETSSIRGEMQHRWGKLTLQLPSGN